MRTLTMKLGNGWVMWGKVNPRTHSIIVSITVFLKFCLLAVTIFLFGGNENANPTVGNSTIEFYSSEFRQQINTDLLFNKNNQNTVDSIVSKFYEQRKFMPAWTLNFKTNHAYEDLISLLVNANSYGLFESSYSVNQLKSFEAQLTNNLSEDSKLKVRLQFEELATSSAFKFMINLSAGVNYNTSNVSLLTLYDKLPGYLNYLISNSDVRSGILNLQPNSEQYKLLQAALVKFLQKANLSSVKFTVEDFQINTGLVKRILIEQGYLDDAFLNDSNAVKTALINYQLLNTIEPTGAADNKTLSVLGRSTNEIYSQIAINLDRLRKDALSDNNYILVNIPEFTLSYVDKNGTKNKFNVVVGKNISPTPMLESKIEHIIANPHWTVPNSIAYNEIIPKIKSDSTYLTKHGYKIVDKDANSIDESSLDWNSMDNRNFKYYIRQDKGEKNALGVIKFLFPNDYSVYLHDTPSKQYFKNNVRAFSHGCVRVENPDKLADMIISENCSADKQVLVENLINSKKQRTLRIDEPVSIYIKYYTCTADSNGNIYFHPDVYSYDNEAIQLLFASNISE